MRKIILGRTNTTVSAISLGTWAFGGENKIGKKSVGWAIKVIGIHGPC